MITWAVISGINALSGNPPSTTLQSLPETLQILWAVLMVVAGLTITLALWKRLDNLVASGMYLFAGTLGAFAIALIGNSGWSRGGAVGSFYFVLGLVSFLRGWWLKGDEARINRQIVRTRSGRI